MVANKKTLFCATHVEKLFFFGKTHGAAFFLNIHEMNEQTTWMSKYPKKKQKKSVA
jgi:hypothetical protein